MSRTYEEREELPDLSSDRALWRRSCLTDTTEDEVSHFLDLAAFADGLLEPDESDRIAARLTADPALRDDVAAARGVDTGADELPGTLERIVARARAILPSEPASRVVAFTPLPRRRRILHGVAQWGSLAAAMVLASWLGFAMGSDTSRALSAPVPSNDVSYLPELFDPGSGFLRDLGEALRT
jgi:anti-sigma factor RsiW